MEGGRDTGCMVINGTVRLECKKFMWQAKEALVGIHMVGAPASDLQRHKTKVEFDTLAHFCCDTARTQTHMESICWM